MTILTQIKKDQLVARKEGNKMVREVLTTLISDAEMIGKNDGNRPVEDIEVIRLIKKYIKTIEENIKIATDGRYITGQEFEKIILEGYLPKQLSKEELVIAIDTILVDNDILTMKGMGLVMKSLMEKYEGQFDGKEASSIVKSRLA